MLLYLPSRLFLSLHAIKVLCIFSYFLENVNTFCALQFLAVELWYHHELLAAVVVILIMAVVVIETYVLTPGSLYYRYWAKCPFLLSSEEGFKEFYEKEFVVCFQVSTVFLLLLPYRLPIRSWLMSFASS